MGPSTATALAVPRKPRAASSKIALADIREITKMAEGRTLGSNSLRSILASADRVP
ncbi:MAG: hypothetical protein M3P70_10640 [Actinomycetota bacterium]|nr:hypothetical protein [Actinomycetota bacterium]